MDHHEWCNSCTGSSLAVPCIFGDILEQVEPPLPTGIGFEGKLQFSRDKCQLQQTQWCYAHGTFCPINRRVDVDFSGLPCPDNSRANRNRMYEEGPSNGVYCVWAKKHRSLQTPLLILENVPATSWHSSIYTLVGPTPCPAQDLNKAHWSLKHLRPRASGSPCLMPCLRTITKGCSSSSVQVIVGMPGCDDHEPTSSFGTSRRLAIVLMRSTSTT